MPWKNGGGSTTELLIEPPGATLAVGFRWRISMATVVESGPFSRFPGCDRTLLLLAGQGMELDHGPHGRALLPGPLEPVVFPGEWATCGRLLGGPCLDFNVMSRRGEVFHDVTIMQLGPTPQPLPEAPTVLVYGARGTAAVTSVALGLRPGELLRIDGRGASGLMAAAVDATAALVVVAIGSRQGPDGRHK
jgi:environmental stress-induced protein Ves